MEAGGLSAAREAAPGGAMRLIPILLMLLAGVIEAQIPPSVTLRWQPVTTMNDGSPLPSNATISYNLYGSHNAAGPWSAAVNVLGTSTIRSGVDLGPLCYYVTSLVNGKESLPSATACVNVTATASSVPSAPQNVTITQN